MKMNLTTTDFVPANKVKIPEIYFHRLKTGLEEAPAGPPAARGLIMLVPWRGEEGTEGVDIPSPAPKEL